MFTPCQGSTLPYHLAGYGQTPADPAFIYHGGPWFHQLHRASPRTTCWELLSVPPRLIIYSNRVGSEPNLPLTGLLTHNPHTVCTVSVLYTTSFDLLRYMDAYKIPNYFVYYTYNTVTICYCHLGNHRVGSGSRYQQVKQFVTSEVAP